MFLLKIDAAYFLCEPVTEMAQYDWISSLFAKTKLPLQPMVGIIERP
jgi:hypothetical protein